MDTPAIVTTLASIVVGLTVLFTTMRVLTATLLTVKESWVKPITLIGILSVIALTFASAFYTPHAMQACVDGAHWVLEWAAPS